MFWGEGEDNYLMVSSVTYLTYVVTTVQQGICDVMSYWTADICSCVPSCFCYDCFPVIHTVAKLKWFCASFALDFSNTVNDKTIKAHEVITISVTFEKQWTEE